MSVLIFCLWDVVSVDESRIEERYREELRFSDADEQRMAKLTIAVCRLEKMLMLIPENF